MTEKFKPNDLVMHAHAPGVRGIVLGYDDRGRVMVCWETGYEPISYYDERKLEEASVLDLLCEGRETEWRFEDTYARCKCGRKLGVKKKAPFCHACQEFFAYKPSPVGCEHGEDPRTCPYGCSR